MRDFKEKTPGDLAVFAKTKELINYTITATNNTNKYPKKMRFTLVNRMQDRVFDLYENLLEANELSLHDKEEKQIRLSKQRRALVLCKELLFFIELSMEQGYINGKSCEYWSKLVFDVKYMTAAWHKKDKHR